VRFKESWHQMIDASFVVYIVKVKFRCLKSVYYQEFSHQAI